MLRYVSGRAPKPVRPGAVLVAALDEADQVVAFSVAAPAHDGTASPASTAELEYVGVRPGNGGWPGPQRTAGAVRRASSLLRLVIALVVQSGIWQVSFPSTRQDVVMPSQKKYPVTLEHAAACRTSMGVHVPADCGEATACSGRTSDRAAMPPQD